MSFVAYVPAGQRATSTGNYRFTSDLTQTTLPLATIANVGQKSRTETLYLDGQNDLRAGQMAFTLWSEGGSVLNADSSSIPACWFSFTRKS